MLSTQSIFRDMPSYLHAKLCEWTMGLFALEGLDLLVGMHAKILDLVKRNRLILGRSRIRGLIIRRICAKGTDFDLSCSHSAHGIYYNCKVGILVLLVCHLRLHVYARQPASVA